MPLKLFLERVLDSSMELLHADCGYLQLYDQPTNTLKLAAHRGLGKNFRTQFQSVDASARSTAGTILRSRDLIVVEDVTEEPTYEPYRGTAAKSDFRGMLLSPIRAWRGSGHMGVLSTMFRNAYRPRYVERRRAELCLQQAAALIASHIAADHFSDAEENLRLVLRAARVGTWGWDAESDLFTADVVQREFFGLPPHKGPLPTEIYWRQMDTDEVATGLENVSAAVKGGGTFQNEQRVTRPNGEVLWLLSRGEVLKSDRRWVQGVSLNITDQVKAERALRESQAHLSAILNQVPGAIGLFDVEGRLLLRGGPLGGLWGDLMPLWHPQSAHRWRGFDAGGEVLALRDYPWARALRGETVTPGSDFVRTDADGQERWIRVSAAPYRNDGGDIAGAVATLQDVDDEKRASDRLRESEARLKAAVDLVGLGLYSWNPNTSELRWDDAVRSMWGLPSGAMVDYPMWRAAIHPDDVGFVDEAVRRSIDPTTEGVYDVEYRVIGLGDGIERWVATRGLTSFAGGKAVWFCGVAIDITERKRTERMLEQRVQARTRELESLNRRLREQIVQREAAEAAAQQSQRLNAIGQITSGVAHDFNNLVAVVLANVRLLERSIHDHEEREGLELIRTAAERGAKVTAQLLAYARRQRLEPQLVDLNAQIAGMTDLLGATLGTDMHLEMTLAPDLNAAVVDPTQIEMIVLNLAINARDAMQGAGALILRTYNAVVTEPTRQEDPPAGDYVAILVEDTGTGIRDDVLPHVFEPFFTTKKVGEGSGLGLAQVLGVVKQSGGGVRIETRVGEGTSVAVFLPIAKPFGNNLDGRQFP